MTRLTFTILLTLLPALVLGAPFLVGVGKSEITGMKGIGFDPSVIHPVAGDTIIFEYRSGMHSVVQSTFENPCTSNNGYNSGVITVSDTLAVDAPGLPQTTLLVNDTQPLYFFDEASGQCQQGAVLAVNVDAGMAAEFRTNAAAATRAPTPASPSATSPTSASASPASASNTSSSDGQVAHNLNINALALGFCTVIAGLLVFSA